MDLIKFKDILVDQEIVVLLTQVVVAVEQMLEVDLDQLEVLLVEPVELENQIQ